MCRFNREAAYLSRSPIQKKKIDLIAYTQTVKQMLEERDTPRKILE